MAVGGAEERGHAGGRSRADRLWAVAVLVLALPFLYIRASHLKEWEDEGYFANGALRVLDGQVIYRDFQHNYPPGRAYGLALLVAVFGHHLWVVRCTWIAFQAAAASIGFLLARRLLPRSLSLAVAATIVLNTAWMNKSTELCLAAFVLWVLFRVVEGRISDLAAGAALAAAGHFRHDVAVFGMVLFPLAAALAVARDLEPGAALGPAVRRRLGGAWKFLAGAALCTLPFLLYLAVHGALAVAWRDLLISGYLANKLLSRPFPPLVETWSPAGLVEAFTSWRFLFYVPFVTYALGLLLAWRLLAQRSTRASGALVLLVTLLGIELLIQVLPRTDIGHLSKAYVPASLLGIVLASESWRAVRALARASRSAMGAVAAACAAAGAALVSAMPVLHVYHLGVTLPNSIPALIAECDRYVAVDLPRGRMWILRGPAEKYAPMFAEIARYAGAEGEWLVVYPAGAMMNFMFDLPNPLRYDLLRPGEMAGQQYGGELVPNHPRVLAEVLQRLEETRPRFLVDSGESTNPELSRLIAQFALGSGYRTVRAARFTMHVREGEPPADGPGR